MTMNYSPTLGATIYLQRLQDFIKTVEGEELPVYADASGGNPTIGWGFALNRYGVDVGIADILNRVLGIDPNRSGLSVTAKASETAFENSLIAILNQSWAPDNTIHHTGSSTTALRAALNAQIDQRAVDIAAHNNGYTATDQAAIGTPVTSFAYVSCPG